jgi:hypothetical protein
MMGWSLSLSLSSYNMINSLNNLESAYLHLLVVLEMEINVLYQCYGGRKSFIHEVVR